VKTISIALGKLAWGMRVQRADGEIFGFSSHQLRKTVTIDGDDLVLEPSNAISVSSIARSMGMAVDNLEVAVVAFDDVLTKLDLLEGRWDGARFYIFQFNWSTPGAGVIPWIAGKFGNATPKMGSYVIELRDLRQELQNDVTRITQANCDYRFGGAACTVDLAPHTYAGEVTGVTNARVFTDAGLVNPADDFAEGEVQWLTGINGGLRAKVSASSGAGVITLSLPMLRGIEVGDTFDIVRGCQKRRVDCIAYDNVLNFPGMDEAPTTDKIVSRADPDAELPVFEGP
jgi:uncharacterized phage protein (TIGR02218 family)